MTLAEAKQSPYWETAERHLRNHQPRLLRELESQGTTAVASHLRSVVEQAETMHARLVGQKATPQQADEIVNQEVLTPMTEEDELKETRRLELAEAAGEEAQTTGFLQWLTQSQRY